MINEPRPRSDEEMTCAILLQGVNVGGHSPLPMTVFRDILTGLGFSNVRTYLQSGNAVLATQLTTAEVSVVVRSALRERLGMEVSVVVRTADELASVVGGWPFDRSAAPTTKHVVFLRQASDAEGIGELCQEKLNPEQYRVSGKHVYLYLPGGMGRSKLGARITGRLARTGATARNWNTVVALRNVAFGGD